MYLNKGSVLQNGKYRIEGLLGQGGFGTTYSAIQTGLNRKVAIKEFFMKELCDRDEKTLTVSVPSSGSRELVDKFKAKFIKEAQMISEFKHPNIVSIYDIFEENGTAYYVMEYHDGGSLSSLSLPLPVAEAVRYIRQVASALSYLHKRNIMHLDVKPANVLIDGEGNAVLIDFGISKRYDESGGQTSSTPVGVSNGYAPIEQYSQAVSKFTPATDAYSLGATFYKLLTGNTPPDASLLVCEPESLVIPSSMPSCFAELIRKCLKPNVSGRPQSIDEFICVLDGYVAQPAQEIKQYKKGVEPGVADDETVMPTVNPVNVKKVSSVNVKKVPPVRTATTSPTKKSRRWLWLALIAGVLAVGAVGFMMLNSGEGQTGDSAFVQHTRELIERVINARTSDEFREARIEADNWFDQLTTEEQRLAKDIAEQYESAIEAQYERFPQQGSHYGYDWVDLGLPSGLKWATCNVGASTPADYGNYYAWGETRPKSEYTEYSSASYGKSWGDIGGDSSRDAARANWGGSWRMPTRSEFQELIDNCTWTWTTQNGHNGYEVMGRNGYSIFLPAAGYRSGDTLYEDGVYGQYWSSTPLESDTDYACMLYSSEGDRHVDTYPLCVYGQSVRPVLGDSKMNAVPANVHEGQEWVDLGLSVKWATCNVGACSPEEAGDYFAWGETNTKFEYLKSNSVSYGEDWGDIGGDSNRDAARANWGGSWRMPTKAEFQELIDNCTWTWTTQNGHNGYEVMGRNGYSIFLPAAGYFKSDLGAYGSYCMYWSSTPGPSGTADCAVYASLREDKRFVDYDDCFRGQSVRPVLGD